MRIRKSGEVKDATRVVLEVMKRLLAFWPNAFLAATEWTPCKGYENEESPFDEADHRRIVVMRLDDFIAENEASEREYEWFVASVSERKVVLFDGTSQMPFADGNPLIWPSEGIPQSHGVLIEFAMTEFGELAITCWPEQDDLLKEIASTVDMSMLEDADG